MTLPAPDVELGDHCTTVYNSTLYAYSPNAFQSLELKEGGTWSELSPGVSITGGVCVQTTRTQDTDLEALYIIGGTSNSATSYTGIQRYDYANKGWESLPIQGNDLVNRQNHGAVFLSTSSSILVFSGFQNADDTLSSQTFLISMISPYNVVSYASSAPATVDPILLSWNSSHAAMIPRESETSDVWLFSSEDGWQLNSELVHISVDYNDETEFALISGTDGRKMLECYYLEATPNNVTRIELLAASNDAASNQVNSGFTVDSWPAYINQNSPNVSWVEASLALDEENGLAFITGGNDDMPIAIFNQQENSWIDAEEFFFSETIIQSEFPSYSESFSSTSPSSTSSSETDDDDDDRSQTFTVLGGTLGAVFAIAAIAILLLFLKKRFAKRKQKSDSIEIQRLDSVYFDKDIMAERFSCVQRYKPSLNTSQNSFSLMSGKILRDQRAASGRTSRSLSAMKKESSSVRDNSDLRPILDKFPMVGEQGTPPRFRTEPPPEPPPTAKSIHGRSSGWSRYFANNEATNLARIASGRSTFASNRSSGTIRSEFVEPSVYSQSTYKAPSEEFNFRNSEESLPDIHHNTYGAVSGAGIAVSLGLPGGFARGSLTSDDNNQNRNGFI